jgi:hypothetical protein
VRSLQAPYPFSLLFIGSDSGLNAVSPAIRKFPEFRFMFVRTRRAQIPYALTAMHTGVFKNLTLMNLQLFCAKIPFILAQIAVFLTAYID